MFSSKTLVALAAILAFAAALAPTASPVVAQSAASPAPAQQATDAPTLQPAAATPEPIPSATATPAPRRRGLFGGLFHRGGAPAAPANGAAATPTPSSSDEPNSEPTSPAFATLDGVWEIQTQYDTGTTYSHFKLAQDGTALSGYWLLRNGTKVPVTGTYDGHNVKLVAKNATVDTTFSGYVLTGADMVGLRTDEKASVAFTAAHREKAKFFENLQPGAGLPSK